MAQRRLTTTRGFREERGAGGRRGGSIWVGINRGETERAEGWRRERERKRWERQIERRGVRGFPCLPALL